MSTPEQLARLAETDRKLRAMAALFPEPGGGRELRRNRGRNPYTPGLRIADSPRTEPSDLGLGR